MSRYIPTGSFTLSKRPAAFPSYVWHAADRQVDGTIHTIDGTRYIDLMCALGALVVGNHPLVVEAVTRQMRDGAIFSLPSELEAEVAQRLCAIIPCADQVKVVKTGSEATAAAVRIARAATGRERVLAIKSHYHGWHDWWAVNADKHPGVPEFMRDGVRAFSSVAALLDCGEGDEWFERDSIAAIIVEPERVEQETPGALSLLSKLCANYGIVLIFDEMLSGGRLALAGAQEYYGVTPDLATYGKAFGGGLPFAFVCGRRDLMDHAWPISGTFSGDALGLAACNAMLNVYANERIIDILWSYGERVIDTLTTPGLISRLGLRIRNTAPRFWFEFRPEIDRRLAMSVFVQFCASRGVLVHPAVVFMSAALSPQEVKHVATVMAQALEYVADGLDAGDLRERRLAGELYEDSVR